MRVLLSFDNRLVFGFANRYIDNALGELVHVARARGPFGLHAHKYGAARGTLQSRSSMPRGKLSHYRRVREILSSR
jgi:hypothetical protein